MDRAGNRAEHSKGLTCSWLLVIRRSADALVGEVTERYIQLTGPRVLEITAPPSTRALWEGRKGAEKHTYCMCVTVSSMFVTGWFVAAVGWGPVVHEPGQTKTHHVRQARSM